MGFFINGNQIGNSSIPRDGLTLWLDTAVYRSWTGAGSTAWNDLSHYEYDTTLVNANSENIHNSIDFDGTGDYAYNGLNYGSSNTIQYCTVLAWIKTGASGGAYNDNWAIIDFDRSEVFNLYIREDTGKIGLSFDDGGGIHDIQSNTACNDDNWHHVGFTFVYNSSPEVTFYLDGEADGTDTSSNGSAWGTSQATRYCIIGDGSEATSANGSRNEAYYNGEIGALYFWEGTVGSTLSAAQVNSLFQRDRSRFGI